MEARHNIHESQPITVLVLLSEKKTVTINIGAIGAIGFLMRL